MSAHVLQDDWPDYARARDGQALAATPGACAWVAANAGSGKTKVLIDRVARLLLSGADPDSILCVTYTRAAAAEMQARLFERLGAWCVMEDTTLVADLEKLEGKDFNRRQLNRARNLFARALETPGGLRIETIHAFCGRVLRRFPLEAGVPPGFSELDDVETVEMWDGVLRALGRRASLGEADLVQAARTVAECDSADLAILRALDARRGAVTGFIKASGGLERAIERVGELLEADGSSEAEIFDRAMGPELPRAELKQALAGFQAGGKTDQKFAEAVALALSDAPAAERFWGLWSIQFTDKGEPRKNAASLAARRACPLLVDLFGADYSVGREGARLATAAQAACAARVFERSAALLRLADAAFSDFAGRKSARAGLDFDDLIHSVSGLLTRKAAAEWVLWKLDGGVEHILLDEAQDTSPGQWTILNKITEDIFAGLGAERARQRTLFVVGDRKQSIYSFQGADPVRFLAEGRRLQDLADKTKVAFHAPHLAMSFRSTQEVLSFVDEVFDPARCADGAASASEAPHEAGYAPHVSFRRREAGCVELWDLEPRDEQADVDPWHAPVDQQSSASPKARLARRIARFIRSEIEAGVAVWDRGERRPARPGDFLILVRGRTAGLFDALLDALKRERLPVAGADRLQLLDSLAVQDLLNLVRFALCPLDDLVLAEILKGPFGGVDDAALEELAWNRDGSLWDSLLGSGRHGEVCAFLHTILARRFDAPFEFLTSALDEPGPGGVCGWDLVLGRFGPPAREPVSVLLDRAAAFDAGAPASLALFLAAIERQGGEVKRELTGKADEVRVMTVHGAKGLEAPIVILPDTTAAPRLEESGLFFCEDGEGCGAPIWAGAKQDGDTPRTAALRQQADERALSEHERLLYVALTRAQDRLVIAGAWSGRTEAGFHKHSWYARCLSGMTRLLADGRAHRVDGPDIAMTRLGDACPRAQGGAVPRTDVGLPDWLRRPAPPEDESLAPLAPSMLGVDPSPTLTPFGAGRARRLRRGRLIHELVEALPALPAAERRSAAAACLERQPDLTRADRAEILEATFGVLDDPRFAAVFGPASRAEVPILGSLGARRVSGRVDRLVVLPGEVIAIDLKTDRPAPRGPDEVGPAYLAQMGAYRAVLASAWPGRTVRCALLWTDGPQLMELDAGRLDAALKAALAGADGV
jgi:ATP-dependent helicase/nuclease subunit A